MSPERVVVKEVPYEVEVVKEVPVPVERVVYREVLVPIEKMTARARQEYNQYAASQGLSQISTSLLSPASNGNTADMPVLKPGDSYISLDGSVRGNQDISKEAAEHAKSLASLSR
jgi:hypothetical protein